MSNETRTIAGMDTTGLLEGAVSVVRQAADEVMSRYRSAQQIWDKDGNESREPLDFKNPLTEADLAADRVLREGLLALLPGSGWLSEETGDSPERLDREAVWIVDPIDGTREYVEGVDDFAISVALAVAGQPALAVMLNPARDDLFTCVAGQGVLRNGEPTRARERDSLGGAVLLASRTETKRGEFKMFQDRMVLSERGSTAYKLALVAAGEADLYFTRTPRNEWDVAAGILLCREAGARVTDLGGDDHTFNRPDPLCRGVVAATKGTHAEVMGLIRQVGTLE